MFFWYCLLGCYRDFIPVSITELIFAWLMSLGNCGKMFENYVFQIVVTIWKNGKWQHVPTHSWKFKTLKLAQSPLSDLSSIWSMALNLGFKEHLKALTAVCASTTRDFHGDCGSGSGVKSSVSILPCVRMKTQFKHLVRLFFMRRNCSFPLSCDHNNPMPQRQSNGKRGIGMPIVD